MNKKWFFLRERISLDEKVKSDEIFFNATNLEAYNVHYNKRCNICASLC